MGNISIELDCAKAILKTYHQVNDTTYATRKNNSNRSKISNSSSSSVSSASKQSNKLKTKELELELNELQEKYSMLQSELNSKEELLARVNRQLVDRTTHLEKLQEDFENAIYQFTNVAIGNRQQ
jgi:hypothetical protein